MKKRGRPPKIKMEEPLSTNNSLMHAALEIAKDLHKMYSEEKINISTKYQKCDIFKQGAEYKSMLSRAIGRIEAVDCLIKKIKELLK